ncbi:glycoside hydrolase family 57 protein [Methanococcoides seepicolus]|uniref:Glycoside hydrolase family 57 protein n=1 Tax=Methanococcoides seepicolus TaxID=2828780 RepID=A0A9E4ZGX8_9EURY|nr:glycoside hydrolase family 57 protein [Methanococcoides seepicolus]MCM1987455.1 glycoside hydrolase family 57 protein [Methanococcoides seepicolus]
MKSVCMYFQLHQPYRLKWFWPDDSKGFERYFDVAINRSIFEKVARKCYLPATTLLAELVDQHEGNFKFSVSITGTLLSQCEKWNPDVLDVFTQLADSKRVEFLDETNYHSLASLFDDKDEFREEVQEHHELTSDLLGVKPQVFRNTELLYNNSIAETVSSMGYKAILTEGVDQLLDTRSPNHVYKAKDCALPVLLRNYKMSDDIGYRFSARWWEEYPLTADKWAHWASTEKGDCMNIFMDYETFGEHQWSDSGIFDFLRALPGEVLNKGLEFNTPSEIVEKYEPVGEVDVGDFNTISWADMERDTSAWLGNDMQRRCFEEAKRLGPYVKRTNDPKLINIWRHLLTSDHYYYMSTKWLGDGDVHSYFSIHTSPYDAAINFIAALLDFKSCVFRKLAEMNKE